jgi:hypothetical protein
MPSSSVNEATVENTSEKLSDCHISCNGSHDDFVEDDVLEDDRPQRPPRCVGKCVMQLGEVTQHNIMVSVE